MTKFIFLLLVFVSQQIYAGGFAEGIYFFDPNSNMVEVLVTNEPPSFGLIFVSPSSQGCSTNVQKSFLSWKMPFSSKNIPPGGAVNLNSVKIEVQEISKVSKRVRLTGYSNSELHLQAEFDSSNELYNDLKNYLATKSKSNKVFIITDSENCLDRHSYKVENYSILNPWQ